MPADCESLAPAHATIQVPTTGRYPSVSPDLALLFRLAHVASRVSVVPLLPPELGEASSINETK